MPNARPATARRAQLADRRSASVVQPTIAAVPSAGDDTIGTLVGLQAEYAAWLAALPANLRDSAIADVLQAICELDLGELPAIEPPRGFGRD